LAGILIGPTKLDLDIAAIDHSGLAQTLTERRNEMAA
jgi:hypothetical protein